VDAGQPLSESGETRRKIWWIWCFRRNDDQRTQIRLFNRVIIIAELIRWMQQQLVGLDNGPLAFQWSEISLTCCVVPGVCRVEPLGEGRPFRPRQVTRAPATRRLRRRAGCPAPGTRFAMGVAAVHGRSPAAGCWFGAISPPAGHR
jgi:hypothetical protein